jgi:hypothetical protein
LAAHPVFEKVANVAKEVWLIQLPKESFVTTQG